MHHAQPKEGHKIWLTQEADAKSWSSLKHVQPKEGLKELGIRYHNPRESRHFPRGAQGAAQESDSERYPGLFFFVSFFSSLSFLIRDVVAKSLRAMEETRADRSLPWEQ
jgi:hypothetical protein